MICEKRPVLEVSRLGTPLANRETMLSETFEANQQSQQGGDNRMKKQLINMLRKGRKGQSLVEYALILALISVVAILVLRGIGQSATNKLNDVNTNLAN